MITQCPGAGPNTTGTSVLQVRSGYPTSWETVGTRVNQVCAIPCTIDLLRVQCVDPQIGADRTWTFVKNNTSQSLATTVSGGSTKNQDATNSASIAAGDTCRMLHVTSGTPPAASASIEWNYRITSSNAGEGMFQWGSTAGAPAGTTRYSPIDGTGAVQSTEGPAESICPQPCTIDHLYIAFDSNMAGGNQVCTLYKNGIAQALAATCASGSAAANDTATSPVSFVAGDTWSLEWVNNGSNAPRPSASVRILPTNQALTFLIVPANFTVAQNLTRYQIYGVQGWGSTENIKEILLQACTAQYLYASVTGVAITQTAQLDVRKNAGNSGITVTIDDSPSTGNDVTNTGTYANDDELSFRIITSLASGTVTPSLGLALSMTQANVAYCPIDLPHSAQHQAFMAN